MVIFSELHLNNTQLGLLMLSSFAAIHYHVCDNMPTMFAFCWTTSGQSIGQRPLDQKSICTAPRKLHNHTDEGLFKRQFISLSCIPESWHHDTKAANKLSFFNVIPGTEEELRACRIFILVVRQFTKKVLMMGTGEGCWTERPSFEGFIIAM